MEYYIKLQQDKDSGLLSDQQYADALKLIKWNQKKKQVRSRKLTKDETNIRKAVRTITKWVFDAKLERPFTPLYVGAAGNETFDLDVFLPMAKLVISYAKHYPIGTKVKDQSILITTIAELVKNRRKNLRNSRKKDEKGNYKFKPLHLVYHNKDTLLVSGKDGKMIQIRRPHQLPLSSSSKGTGKKHQVVSNKDKEEKPPSMTRTATPAPPNAVPTPLPPLPPSPPPYVANAADVVSSESDSPSEEFDLFKLQEEIQKKMDMLKNKMKKYDQQKSAIAQTISTAAFDGELSRSGWLKATADQSSVTLGGAQNRTCRNPRCGRDCLTSITNNQNQEGEMLCQRCWSAKKIKLLSMSSTTGAKKTKKRKVKDPKSTPTPRKKQRHEQQPDTPESTSAKLKRKVTPPIIKTKVSKYKVINYHV